MSNGKEGLKMIRLSQAILGKPLFLAEATLQLLEIKYRIRRVDGKVVTRKSLRETKDMSRINLTVVGGWVRGIERG